tara:strand:- start:83 stop:316 length:234 start_codon:yes stop_codon:yes gene_type:complete
LGYIRRQLIGQLAPRDLLHTEYGTVDIWRQNVGQFGHITDPGAPIAALRRIDIRTEAPIVEAALIVTIVTAITVGKL